MQNEKHRPTTNLRGLCLIHDNETAHKCHRFLSKTSKKEKKKIVQPSNPPYSPDLSPCDCFLYKKEKKTLSGRRYESRRARSSAIYQCLQGIPKKA